MAELTTQERLQPSLLDRLTDDEPSKAEESRERRVISAIRLRDCVTRDISWLLNCVRLDSEDGLHEFPEVYRSVINFGIPDLAGLVMSGLDAGALERQIKDAITTFEPRLIPHTVRVIATKDDTRMNRQGLSFNIDAQMWATPIPLNLYLKTEVDLENGSIRVSESLG